MFFAPATHCLCLRLLVSNIFARCGKAYVMLMLLTEVVFSKCERQGNNNQILRCLFLICGIHCNSVVTPLLPLWQYSWCSKQCSGATICRLIVLLCFLARNALAQRRNVDRASMPPWPLQTPALQQSLAQRTGWLVFAGVGVAGFCPWCAASYCLGDFLFLMTAQHSKA